MQSRKIKGKFAAGILVLVIGIGGLWIGHSARRDSGPRRLSKAEKVEAAMHRLQISDSKWRRLWAAVWPMFPAVLREEFPEFKPVNVRTERSLALADLTMSPPATDKVLPVLLKTFDDPDYGNMRAEMLETLSSYGPLAKPVLPQIIAALDSINNTDPSKRSASYASYYTPLVHAGTAIGGDDPELVDVLCKSLEQLDDTYDYFAARAVVSALASVASATNKVIPALADSLDRETQVLRGLAIEALGKIGPKSPRVVEALIKELGKSGPATYVALQALKQVGPPAREVAPLLIHLYQGEKNGTLPASGGPINGGEMLSLNRMPAPLPLPTLPRSNAADAGSRKSSDPRPFMAVSILSTLAEIGTIDTIPFLAKEVQDENSPLRFDAARARWRIDHQPQLALPVLESGFQAASPDLRRAVARYAAEIGLEARPILLKALRNDDDQVRLIALKALCDLKSEDQLTLEELKSNLKDPNHEIRLLALKTFEKAGPAADAQVPSIQLLLKDQKNMVRFAAEKALKAIRPGEAEKWKVDFSADPWLQNAAKN